MSKIGRWFLLTIGLGVFPIVLKLLLRLTTEREIWDIVRDSSDVLFLGLAIGVVTLADLTEAADSIPSWPPFYRRTIYFIATCTLTLAVWYGILELDMLEHKSGSIFREKTWIPALIVDAVVVVFAVLVERKLFTAKPTLEL